MIHVTNGANVYVRLRTLKFLFRHDSVPLTYKIPRNEYPAVTA